MVHVLWTGSMSEEEKEMGMTWVEGLHCHHGGNGDVWAMVMSGLLWDPCLGSGSDAAVVSLDVTPDTTKGLEDRAVDSNTGENFSYPSLAEDSGDDPIPFLGCTIELTIFAGTQVNGLEGLRMGEQVLPLSHAIWWHGWGEDSFCSLAPLHLQQVRNLTQPLTSCITEESRPCTSTGQHNRVNSVGGVIEPTPKLLPWESCSHYSSVLWLQGWGRDALPPNLLRKVKELALE